LIDRVKGASSGEVWSYPIRRLTERFAIIERVPPRYDASLTILYRARRFIRANTRFVGMSSGTLLLFLEDDDLIRNATETILAPGFDPANMKDSEDVTFSQITVPPATTINIVRYDLGAVMDIAIVIALSSQSSANYCRLDVSNDNITYTNILNHNGTHRTFLLITTARYILLNANNTSTTTSQRCNFHTLEAYKWSPSSNVDRTITSTVLKTMTVIGRGYSHLLEVIGL
jgi:hypothetical protein